PRVVRGEVHEAIREIRPRAVQLAERLLVRLDRRELSAEQGIQLVYGFFVQGGRLHAKALLKGQACKRRTPAPYEAAARFSRSKSSLSSAQRAQRVPVSSQLSWIRFGQPGIRQRGRRVTTVPFFSKSSIAFMRCSFLFPPRTRTPRRAR